jgi:hypothetical protein
VFVRCGTQWRIGPAGASGLDYAALPFVMRACGIPRSEWSDVFEDLRVLEVAALNQLAADRRVAEEMAKRGS